MWSLVRRVFPLSASALALWTWRNRDEVLEWTGFGVRAAQKLAGGDRADVGAEARLRLALNRDRRTRHAPGLRVEVRDGVAFLGGVVDPEVRDVAVSVSKRTVGIDRVDDTRLEEVHRRRRGRG
jgi:hypothetical protein